MPLWSLFLLQAALPPNPPAVTAPPSCPTPPQYTYSDWEQTREERQFQGEWVVQYLHYSRTKSDECRGTTTTQSKIEGPFRLWPAVPENRVADVNRPEGPTDGLSGAPLRSSSLPETGAPGTVGPNSNLTKSNPSEVPANKQPGPSPFFPGFALFAGVLVASFFLRRRGSKPGPAPESTGEPVDGPLVEPATVRTMDSIKPNTEWVPGSAEVAWLQAFFGIEESGYGPLTKDAVKGFQEKHKIPVDAKRMIGPNTYRALWKEHTNLVHEHWQKRADGEWSPALERVMDSPLPPDLRAEMEKLNNAYAAYFAAVEGRYQAILRRDQTLAREYEKEIATFRAAGVKNDDIPILKEKYQPAIDALYKQAEKVKQNANDGDYAKLLAMLHAADDGRWDEIAGAGSTMGGRWDALWSSDKSERALAQSVLDALAPLAVIGTPIPSQPETKEPATTAEPKQEVGASHTQASPTQSLPDPSNPYGYSIGFYRTQWLGLDASKATPGILHALDAVLRHEGDRGMLQVTPGNLRSRGGDAQGVSLGAFQWNFGQGTLQPLLRDFKRMNPNAWERYFSGVTFGEQGEYSIDSLMQRTEDSSDWDDVIQALHKPGTNKLVEPMTVAFGKLAQDPDWHKIQAKYMGQTEYLPHAVQWADWFGLKSERGLALMLDIAVQNGAYWFQTGSGSQNDRATEVLASLDGNMDEGTRIQAVYDIYAQQLIAGKYSPDGEGRRRAIAAGGVLRNGSGFSSLSTAVPWRAGASAETPKDAGEMVVHWGVPLLKQDDSGPDDEGEWAQLMMAPQGVKSRKTANVANYGCALTSAAMALQYLGVNTDPKDIIERANQNEVNSPEEVEEKKKLGLASVWNLYWYLLAAEFPGVTTKHSEYKDLKQLRTWLEKGPVIIGGSGSNGPHFVVITGYSGKGEDASDFTINDPGQDRASLADFLEDYPTAEVVVQYGK